MRQASLSRNTTETRIELSLNLDGTGTYDVKTGVGFFDHMLEQLARHSLMDLTVRAEGDLHIDDHHTVEDVGIALGQALKQAIGDKKGIRRYGSCHLPMDEALSFVALDLSNRPFLVWNAPMPTQKIGTFDTELVREFFQALASNGGITLHAKSEYGDNCHHVVESLFKALAKALREAVSVDPALADSLPSTKGAL